MGIVRSIDRRREARTPTDLPLRVWGIDTRGERFMEEARACDISLNGAMLSGVTTDLRSGDVVGILYAGRAARYRVVWVRYDEAGDKMKVAVHRIESDACPWLDLLVEQATDPGHPTSDLGRRTSDRGSSEIEPRAE